MDNFYILDALKKMLDTGVLTEEEYHRVRKRYVDKIIKEVMPNEIQTT